MPISFRHNCHSDTHSVQFFDYSPYEAVYSHSLSGYQINCNQSFKSTFKSKSHFKQRCHMSRTHHWPQVRVASLSSIKMIRVWKINLKCLTALTLWYCFPKIESENMYRLLLRTPATEGRARVLNTSSVAVSVLQFNAGLNWKRIEFQRFVSKLLLTYLGTCLYSHFMSILTFTTLKTCTEKFSVSLSPPLYIYECIMISDVIAFFCLTVERGIRIQNKLYSLLNFTYRFTLFKNVIHSSKVSKFIFCSVP